MEDLGRVDIDAFKVQEKKPIIAVLDNVRSALNVGSVFRTADAFAIKKIYLCGITACPPNREITKTAIGATESVDWEYVDNTPNTIKRLKEQGYKVYCVEQTDNSKSLLDFENLTREIAVVFGNEVEGVSEEAISVADGCIEIPQYGTKHSLNVSVCAGIVLWTLAKHK
jgi:23S rRNA (guanosine2251-2'-O)-methyltransferase